MQASKTRVLILIIVAALLTAGIIVLAWLVLRHMLLAAFSLDCPAGTCGGRGFNPYPERAGEPGI